LADDARGRRQRDDVPRALFSHHRKYGASHVHRAKKVRCQLRLELFRRQLFEEPGEEVTRIVDQHINATEPVGSGLHGCSC
jgi:hypothetical protein